MKALKVISLIFCLGFVLSCEDTDKSKMAEAQSCLDKINQSQPEAALATAAQACVDLLGSASSSQASIIRCSGQFLINGITTSKILDAFQTAEGAGASSSAGMMMSIAVTSSTDTDTNKARAKAALDTCSSSGVSGLIWLAGLSNVGTTMVNSFLPPSCGGDPSACGDLTQGEVDSIVTSCSGGGSSCDPAEVGASAIVMSQTYCIGSNASSEECMEINAAVANGGGDPTAVGNYLLGNF